VRDENSVAAARRAHPNVNFRHMVKQSEGVKGIHEMSFDQRTI